MVSVVYTNSIPLFDVFVALAVDEQIDRERKVVADTGLGLYMDQDIVGNGLDTDLAVDSCLCKDREGSLNIDLLVWVGCKTGH
jgi:hypothetical protein